ncbi:MAG TPA: TonB family protein [Candidatus Solibacter sp.]|nr:TonB family protein [Candidatus Solibacter sp.]
MPIPDPAPGRSSGALSVPEQASFETDFTELVERFSTQSGGGLSAELSVDLALEIVLNEIVEQACLATGATGAAIVLQRDGEMVCRASSGATAPELGARLDTSSGISGECLRTWRMQRCDDVSADPRADVQASRRLGIQSVMVIPLIRRGELEGVFEVLSSQPHAFGERDERTLEALAGRALNNLDRAAERLKRRSEPAVQVPTFGGPIFGQIPNDGFDENAAISSSSGTWRFDFLTLVLGAGVVVCALLLGIVMGPHLGIWKSRTRPRTAAAARIQPARTNTTQSIPPAETTQQNPAGLVAADAIPGSVPTDPVKKASAPAVPVGGLVVYDEGKQVFRMLPTADGQAGGTSSSTGSSVLQRIAPEYPAEALQKKIEGTVVLDVHIAPDGSVRETQLISGDPLLAQAAKDAVQQWKFKPRTVNGHPAEMETQITLNFRLPQAK